MNSISTPPRIRGAFSCYNSPMLVDSHCHLHDREFYSDEEVKTAILSAKAAGVEKIVCIGTNHADSLNAQSFARTHENVFWTYGVHPSEWDDDREAPDFSDYPPVAIGEVGLDYHYGSEDREEQKSLLREMLNLAEKYRLPLSFHIREAFDDFFAILAEYPDNHFRGVIHSFSDSKSNLQKCLDYGFYIGVNGLATYAGVPLAPVEKILLETDAPFLVPAPYHQRHKEGDGSPIWGLVKNEPKYIKTIAEFVAEKQGISLEEVAEITTKNVKDLFGI